MTNPQVTRSHNFKNICAFVVMAGVLPCPSIWALLPILVHVVDTSKRSRPSSSFIHHHESFFILLIGSSEVFMPKDTDASFCKKRTHFSVVSSPMRRYSSV